MKVLILGSQHGNEYLGEKLYRHIVRSRPELKDNVEYVLANPKAREKRVRLIESDMNRSYVRNPVTYEERRAQEIREYINKYQFDIVLDCHTTSCVQPPSLIVASINSVNEAYLKASSIAHIIHMNHSITQTTLNDISPQSVSLEVNEKITPELLNEVCDDIKRYIHQESAHSKQYVYEVTELLHGNELPEEELINIQNFKKTKQGFYPILVGENSYKKYFDYIGFKAYKRKVLEK